MRAIEMTEFGGPEVLQLAELPVPEPGEGEVLIEVSRAGINFADTHTRTNSYVQRATLPLIPGGEVAGVIAQAPAGGDLARTTASWRSWGRADTPNTQLPRRRTCGPYPRTSTTRPRWR